jgi:hypothetical protein
VVVCLTVGSGFAEADVSVMFDRYGCLGGEGGLDDRMERWDDWFIVLDLGPGGVA